MVEELVPHALMLCSRFGYGRATIERPGNQSCLVLSIPDISLHLGDGRRLEPTLVLSLRARIMK
jgi:hypothetical protein